ncbi:hypothetical protein D3C72_1933290 [compost metagenome]
MFSVSALATEYTYVCPPSMSHPDRNPWLLKVDEDQLWMGQDTANMKHATKKAKNNNINWLINYVQYEGQISEFAANNYFYAFIKPELRSGTGGWLAIGWRDGLSFFETMYLCERQ